MNSARHGFIAMDICDPAVDFQSLAKSMGVEAISVTSHREISETVDAAIKARKPCLIEIPVTGVAGN